MTAGVVIEIIVFEFLWVMMLFSHTYTMVCEPGYVPKGYKYRHEHLPAKYRNLL